MKTRSKWMLPVFSVALAGTILLPTTSAVQASSNINVYLNNSPITFTDAQPMIVNNRTLVPIRAISENIGYQVKYDSANQQVTVIDPTTTVSLMLNSDTASVNGKAVKLDTNATLMKGRTYGPLRFIAENLNCKVDAKNSGDNLNVYIQTFTGDNTGSKEVATTTSSQPTAQPEDTLDGKTEEEAYKWVLNSGQVFSGVEKNNSVTKKFLIKFTNYDEKTRTFQGFMAWGDNRKYTITQIEGNLYLSRIDGVTTRIYFEEKNILNGKKDLERFGLCLPDDPKDRNELVDVIINDSDPNDFKTYIDLHGAMDQTVFDNLH